jgi:hypothetical protein
MDLNDLVPLLLGHVLEAASPQVRFAWGCFLVKRHLPLVTKNTGIVNEDGDPTESIESSLNDRLTVSDGGRVYDSFASGWQVDVSQYGGGGLEEPSRNSPWVISSTTFCAASLLKSLTTTFAPLDANNSEYLTTTVRVFRLVHPCV